MQSYEQSPSPDLDTAVSGHRQDDGDVGHDEGESGQAASTARDPAWRLIAWLLPLAAGVSALLALGEMLTGGVDRGAGLLATLAYGVLCAGLLRDALRRARTGRWARTQVYEFGPPLALLIVALALLARGADLIACVPALFVLLPVLWGFAHAPPAERAARLLPHALPMLGHSETVSEVDHGEVEGIVRAVLDGLPPDIAARLESGGWSVEVRDELPAGPRDETVYGCCFYGANVIAIYRLPHLWTYGHGDVLRRGVTYTVLHEIGHALGLDETGVRRLGWLGD